MVKDNDRLSGRVGAGLPIYEFNDTFDEKHLNQNLYWSINRLYTRALDGQRGLCHILRYNGKFSEFRRDSRINTAFDLPYNTYTIKLPLTVINFFSSKAAKEINSTMRNQADFWRNGTEETIAKNANRKIQDETWRCGKTHTNIMWNGVDPNPMHTPDYYYDRESRYMIRDLCATSTNGTRYKIDKASFPYLYSIQETYGMTKIFTHHFVVFINGYIFSDAKFFCDNNFLYVFLCTNNPSDKAYANDLVNENIIKQWRKDEVPFTIMGFPFSTTKGYMGNGKTDSGITEDGISYDIFEENLTPNMQFRNNIWLLGYSDPEVSTFFLTPSLAKLTKDNEGNVKFVGLNDTTDSSIAKTVSNIERLYMEAFNLKNAFGISFIGGERSFFIPLEKNGVSHNPVPPQNVMLFEMNDNNEIKLLHSAVIKLYYPNVYRVTNVDESTKILVLWFVNTEDTSEHNLFDNPLKKYMEYNPYYKSSILYGTLPKAVMDYVPATVTYDYDNYFVYRRSAKSNHNEYMIDKISEVMRDNPERYEYIYSSLMEKTSIRLHANPKQVVYLDELEGYDIDAMAVDTNELACKPYDVPVRFKIPHVGFRIEHHENVSYRYAIWVDGVLQDVPHIYDNSFTTWIFIPVETMYGAKTLEVEMMRVTGRGRIQAEIDFGEVDNSVEIPHVFDDISPQNMIISIRKNIMPEQLEIDNQLSYAKYAHQGVVFAEDGENGSIITYRVAPDYEMSWVLTGSHKYVNGELTDGPDGVFHEDKIIEYPYFDENGQPQVTYVERNKCKHSTLDEFYSRPEHLDWTTGSTIMTDVQDDLRETYINAYPRRVGKLRPNMITRDMLLRYQELYPRIEETDDGVLGESAREWYDRIVKLIIEKEPPVYIETEEEFEARVNEYMDRHSDNAIMMPLNVAINRNYFKSSDDMYFVTAFDSKWPNGFYALDRRRFYQYLPYGKDAAPLYVTPIGKPNKAETIEAITKYIHFDDENYDYNWISGSPMKDNDVVYYNPGTRKWYSINDSRDESEIVTTQIIDPDRVRLAIAKGSTLYANRTILLEPFASRAVTEINIPNIPESIETTGIYVTAFVHEYTYNGETVYRVEFLPHYALNYNEDPRVVGNYDLSEYTEVPNSTFLVKDSESDNGDTIYPTFEYNGTEYTSTAGVFTQEELDSLKEGKPRLGSLDWDESLKELVKYYPNSDVYFDNSEPHSFFQNQHAIIQNTDFYYKRHYVWDFQSSMSVTTDYFYDDPSFHKFRISINGRRVDHGTDYITDVDMINGYMRGSPIKITFRDTPTVKNSIASTYDAVPHITGKLVGPHTLYEAISIDDINGVIEYSTVPFEPDASFIYHNTLENNKPYVWNGTKYVEWDGINLETTIKLNADVLFEFLPYKDRVVWKSKTLKFGEVRVPQQTLERPLSFAYYDFYLNGVKLTPDKITITSPRSFRFNSGILYTDSTITIYERCHDKDLYGNAGYMPDSIDDILADKINDYKEYLYTT